MYTKKIIKKIPKEINISLGCKEHHLDSCQNNILYYNIILTKIKVTLFFITIF